MSAAPVLSGARLADEPHWIVDIEFQVAGRMDLQRSISVERGASMPVPEAIVEPLGAVRIVRADVLPAHGLDEIPVHARGRYTHHYALLQLTLRAAARGKSVGELVAWRDFDPIAMDEDVRRWLCAGAVRFAGD